MENDAKERGTNPAWRCDAFLASHHHQHPVLFLLGPVFGSKDNFLGLGVFVDTYPNEEKQQEVSEGR